MQFHAVTDEVPPPYNKRKRYTFSSDFSAMYETKDRDEKPIDTPYWEAYYSHLNEKPRPVSETPW